MNAWQIIWFILIAFLLVGYTVLDGYDLGVGFWTALLRNENDRRKAVAAIAPFWDANEVWLVTGAGATFAAFPAVYAAAFSGLYPLLFLVLFSLLVRGVAIEFGSQESGRRHSAWSLLFAAGSTAAAFFLGIILGDIVRGLPLLPSQDVRFTFSGLVSPFSVLFGVLNVALLATHGGLFLGLRTTDQLHKRALGWAQGAWYALFVLVIAAVVGIVLGAPHLVERYLAHPAWLIVPGLAAISLLLTGIWTIAGRAPAAFLASTAMIVLMLASVVIGLFPTMIPALPNTGPSLTAANASSSPLALKTMFVITLIGMPFVLGYTIWIHHLFRKTDESLHY